MFWAGHQQYSLRHVYLAALKAHFGESFDTRLPQDAYTQTLLGSRAGLCCFGFGYDTVRYWELPAHGCLLLAEQLPIAVPHDFEDGKHALFFRSLPELRERLRFCAAEPEAVEAMSRAGHAHLRAHHTDIARAQQFLAGVRAARVGG